MALPQTDTATLFSLFPQRWIQSLSLTARSLPGRWLRQRQARALVAAAQKWGYGLWSRCYWPTPEGAWSLQNTLTFCTFLLSVYYKLVTLQLSFHFNSKFIIKQNSTTINTQKSDFHDSPCLYWYHAREIHSAQRLTAIGQRSKERLQETPRKTKRKKQKRKERKPRSNNIRNKHSNPKAYKKFHGTSKVCCNLKQKHFTVFAT